MKVSSTHRKSTGDDWPNMRSNAAIQRFLASVLKALSAQQQATHMSGVTRGWERWPSKTSFERRRYIMMSIDNGRRKIAFGFLYFQTVCATLVGQLALPPHLKRNIKMRHYLQLRIRSQVNTEIRLETEETQQRNYFPQL